jgi:cell division protein FtsN
LAQGRTAEARSAEARTAQARTAEARSTGEFTVQLGAFRSLESALSLAEEVREAGQDPRVVRLPGNDLARVRVGRFPAREAAVQLSDLLERLGFEVTLATDAGSEEQIGTGG